MSRCKTTHHNNCECQLEKRIKSLYDVPEGTEIIIMQDDVVTPIAAPKIEKWDKLKFSRLDGRYSACYKDGKLVHIGGETLVAEIING